jgi:hypothetical protein
VDDRKTIDWLRQYFKQCRTDKNVNQSTFVMPDFGRDSELVLNIAGLNLSDAPFLGYVQLACRGPSQTLARTVFHDDADIVELHHTLNLDGAVFHKWLKINAAYGGKVDMAGAECRGPVELLITGSTATFNALDFRRVRFLEVPTLSPNSVPQKTSFYRAKFQGNATKAASENAHRALRVAFAENSDREMEGLFYTLEKRCHRRSLQWWPSWFARIVSCLYDWTSNYGRRYELALGWLIGVQIAFGVGYSIASDRWAVPGEFDSTIAAFTIGQLVRPFEPYSARAASSTVYQEIFGAAEPSGGWISWMTVHSVISLSLFALMLLAMRWWFRRE